MKNIINLLLFLSLFISFLLPGQTTFIAEKINAYKQDRRGPYKDIKWFCEDGTIREARDPCPEPMEGVQHARYKDEVLNLRSKYHIFLDQILVETDKTKFWDANNHHSRIKQYQLTSFLFNADNGWILQQAQNYRGAKQIEDEQEWGYDFLQWLMQSDQKIKSNYLLIRSAMRDIPHREETSLSQRIRAYSKLLGDARSDFMSLRIKIHNNPGKEDLQAVRDWGENKTLKAQNQEYYSLLIKDMEEWYEDFDPEKIESLVRFFPESSQIRKEIAFFGNELKDLNSAHRALRACELLKMIRENFFDSQWTVARARLIDLSIDIEDLVLKEFSIPENPSIKDLTEQVCFLLAGLYGGGYIEEWEYKKAMQDTEWLQGEQTDVASLEYYVFAVNKILLWATQKIQSTYAETIHLYLPFEPLAYGFVDDQVRSSIILPFGIIAEKLGEKANALAGTSSQIFGKDIGSGVQGLNPGLAHTQLTVLESLPENTALNSDNIYAFDRPPADMKPVAGILNVQEGNPISHIQLLARNLGIPNALISSDILSRLKNYDGDQVFYAVSPKGRVILKAEKEMTKKEKSLVKTKERSDERIKISTDQLIMDPDSLLDMSKIDATYSGKWCGPKAANLGQLKKMFPEHVVDGIVIPFGVFNDHLAQEIPGIGESYWTYLKRIFENEKAWLEAGSDPKEVECVTLQELQLFREHVKNIALKPEFVSSLKQNFNSIFGKSIGQIPVFLRSDTNMEDLPEFTGAGLNLTLFNVVDQDKILNGIKEVWASPYTERSYRWRQQYLLNPEDVYPSILIIPSVDVDRSGVIVTKGLSRGDTKNISISFSRGVGGAVEGQSAESYLIWPNGYAELVSPGRETKFRRIPPTGGSIFEYTDFESPVLSQNMLRDLVEMTKNITVKLDSLPNTEGPYDIELGIKDEKIWLFQVRPFVENKNALKSDYLLSLDPPVKQKMIKLNE